MSNNKTAEEILDHVKGSDTDRHFPASTYEEDYAGGSRSYVRKDLALIAMHEYSAQQLKEYREVIRELLDIAEIHVNRHGNDYSVVDRYAMVRNARKLIDQTESTK